MLKIPLKVNREGRNSLSFKRVHKKIYICELAFKKERKKESMSINLKIKWGCFVGSVNQRFFDFLHSLNEHSWVDKIYFYALSVRMSKYLRLQLVYSFKRLDLSFDA